MGSETDAYIFMSSIITSWIGITNTRSQIKEKMDFQWANLIKNEVKKKHYKLLSHYEIQISNKGKKKKIKSEHTMAY